MTIPPDTSDDDLDRLIAALIEARDVAKELGVDVELTAILAPLLAETERRAMKWIL